MPVISVLDCSVAHLTHATRGRLDAPGTDGGRACPVSMSGEYGWLLYVPDDGNVDGDGDPFPADLAAVLDEARRHGCGYVLVDGDGPTVDGLPTYGE